MNKDTADDRENQAALTITEEVYNSYGFSIKEDMPTNNMSDRLSEMPEFLKSHRPDLTLE